MEETHIVDVKVNPKKTPVPEAKTIDSVPVSVAVKKTSTVAGDSPLMGAREGLKITPSSELSKYRTDSSSAAEGEQPMVLDAEFDNTAKPDQPADEQQQDAAAQSKEKPDPIKDIKAPTIGTSTVGKTSQPDSSNDDNDSTLAPAAGEPDDQQLTEIRNQQAKNAGGMQSPKIYDTKEYYLPIKSGKSKSTGSHMTTFLLMLLIILAISAYLAVDAGFIAKDLKLPFEIIKN